MGYHNQLLFMYYILNNPFLLLNSAYSIAYILCIHLSGYRH